ncbi:uncharacterized protein N7483_006644 [Penicillium malachiteum]|uniref:uncharacterized protein n=1 Tax=Penicillium malachiteum TaxID=1324776 RepID=UPI0025497DD9|nr:uncharacterized protein N7483_006644 [Penicillium malachiteum]KAJ5725287.1 hypothetical protein N7483_006644 [Penicillium malachiteum]
MSTSSKEGGGSVKKRDPRPGARRVSSLSAEQLERKRANDREAQRTIRQRTKEHIEQLESQVAMLQNQLAEMQPRVDRFGELLQHNAALEDEVSRLKQQMTTLMGRPVFAATGEQTGAFSGGWSVEERSGNTASSVPSTNTMLSPHFSGSSHPSRAPSVVSASAPNRSPHVQDWQSYNNTRSPSLADSSDPDFSARMDPFGLDGQMSQKSRLVPSSLPVGGPQINLGNSISTLNSQSSETAFSQASTHRSIPMSMTPLASTAQSGPSFQDSLLQSTQKDSEYSYPSWVPQ